MNWGLLGKILMKWFLEHEEYESVYFLYTEFNIGIPVKYLYAIPSRNCFSSILTFVSDVDNIGGCNDKDLNQLLCIFPKSRYMRLSEWENVFGYRYFS